MRLLKHFREQKESTKISFREKLIEFDDKTTPQNVLLVSSHFTSDIKSFPVPLLKCLSK